MIIAYEYTIYLHTSRQSYVVSDFVLSSYLPGLHGFSTALPSTRVADPVAFNPDPDTTLKHRPFQNRIRLSKKNRILLSKNNPNPEPKIK